MAIEVKDKATLELIRSAVVDNWRDMKEERSELEQDWKRLLMAYLNKFDKNWAAYAKQSNRSCRFLALTWDAVETLTAQILSASMTGEYDWLEVVPSRKGFDENDDVWAELNKYLLIYQIEQGKFRREMRTAIRSLVLLGNCPFSTSWDVRKAVKYDKYTDAMAEWADKMAKFELERRQLAQDYQQVSHRAQAMGDQPPPPPQVDRPPRPPKDLEVIYEGPIIQIGSIFNYVQEQNPNEAFGALRIMRTWRTKAYIKKKARANEDGWRLYENVKDIHEMTSEDRSSDNDGDQLIKLALGMQLPHGKDKVELKEMHGTFEVGDGSEKKIFENYIVTVANDIRVIRCEPSPMFSGRPMIQNARMIVPEGATYGVGPMLKCLDEQDTANAVHNQNIDAVNSVIQNELEVVEDQLAHGVMKPSGPGVKHYVTEQGTINPIAKNFQGLPLGMATVDAAISRFERFSGAINTGSAKDETATRTARNTNVMATKLGGLVEDAEDELITEALNIFLEMNAQYIDTDQLFTITQDKRAHEVEVSPAAIRRGWLVRAMGSKYLAEKEDRIQNLMMALQITEQRTAQGIPSPARDDVLYRRLFLEILGESGDIIKSSEEYQAELQEFEERRALELINATGQPGGPSGGSQEANGGQGGGASGPPA